MNEIVEPTILGLSERAHGKLQRLKEDGHFNEMSDAYRFAIALALANGVVPSEVQPPKTTVFNVGTIDPNKEVFNAIKAVFDTGDVAVYRWAERLAEWGVEELASSAAKGE